MKKIVSILAATTILLSAMSLFSACGSNSSSSDAGSSSENQLLVGMECLYQPFNWTQITDANGAVPIRGTKEYAGGYDVEIAKKVAEGLGKELVIVKTDWDGLGPAVESGIIDIIMAGMSPTEERKKTIDFTENYYHSDLVIVVKKGGAYEKAASLAELSGAKITAQQNTFHYTVIDQIEGVKKQAATLDFSAMRVSLESGFIDGYVSEKPEALSASNANDNFAMVEFPEGKGFEVNYDDTAIAAGVKKGREDLIEKINPILQGITEEQRSEIMAAAIKNQPAAQ